MFCTTHVQIQIHYLKLDIKIYHSLISADFDVARKLLVFTYLNLMINTIASQVSLSLA